MTSRANTNRVQFELLVSRLEDRPDIAKGFAKGNQTMFWEQLSEEINAAGPPSKTANEWITVWKNFKYSTKKKWSRNRQNFRATGGGPSTEIPLTPLEERVATMLCYQQHDAGHAGEYFGIENIDPNADNRNPTDKQPSIEAPRTLPPIQNSPENTAPCQPDQENSMGDDPDQITHRSQRFNLMEMAEQQSEIMLSSLRLTRQLVKTTQDILVAVKDISDAINNNQCQCKCNKQ